MPQQDSDQGEGNGGEDHQRQLETFELGHDQHIDTQDGDAGVVIRAVSFFEGG